MSSSSIEVKNHPHLIIVEDDEEFAEILALEFEDRGYRVSRARDLTDLEILLQASVFAFGLIDLRLGGDSGLDAVRLLKEEQPECRTVMLTGYSSIATAVEAIKLGAVNYLQKPAAIERIEKALWIDLPPGGDEPDEAYESLDRHEQEYIEYVMLQCGGNITRAARWLNIHRQSLQRKLKRWGLR